MSAAARQCAATSSDAQAPLPRWCRPAGVIFPTVGAQLAAAGAAVAADEPVAAAAGSVGSDVAAALTENASDLAASDPVVTVLFAAAIGALSIVTLGVAYLALSGIFDERQEKKDRKTFEDTSAARRVAEDRAKQLAKQKVPRRKAEPSSRGGGQGFGG